MNQDANKSLKEIDHVVTRPFSSNVSVQFDMKKLLLTGVVFITSACAYYPKQVVVYDSECNIKYKKLVLGKNKSNMRVGDCKNEACITSLLAIPLQAVVAGSIIVAGNVVYWLEKEGTCLIKDKT